jgi:hypothetical protein
MQQISPRPRLLSMSRPSFDKSDRLLALEARLQELCRSWDALRHEQSTTDRRFEQTRSDIRVVQELMRLERVLIPSTSSSLKEWNHAG